MFFVVAFVILLALCAAVDVAEYRRGTSRGKRYL